MALTTEPKAAAYAYGIASPSSPIVHGVEKASSAWLAGAFIQDDDSGRMTLSVSPIDASGVTKRAIGLARDKATGVTDADVEFTWLDSRAVVEITLSDATATTHTLAQADQWKVYPILKTATGNWYLDANAVSDTGGGIVVGFKDAIGTVDGRVYMILSNTARGGLNAGSGTF